MRSVLVTGGTVRVGRVIAEALREAGWRVLTSSHRADAGADIVADLTQEDGAESLMASAMTLLGGMLPDALVNNAALYRGEKEALWTLNCKAPLRLLDLMAAEEPQGGECRAVVNILDCLSENSEYGGSKSMLRLETRARAIELAGRLRVNAVSLGPVLPPVGVHVKAPVTPFGRPTPQQVAGAVVYLLSAQATSGCVIPVDGGISLARK